MLGPTQAGAVGRTLLFWKTIILATLPSSHDQGRRSRYSVGLNERRARASTLDPFELCQSFLLSNGRLETQVLTDVRQLRLDNSNFEDKSDTLCDKTGSLCQNACLEMVWNAGLRTCFATSRI